MKTEVAVVGGGLAGLIAAALIARAGRAVALFEKAPELGGRALTTRLGGAAFNLGPHALYRGGAAVRVLRSLGVGINGGVPLTSGNEAYDRGALHGLPSGPVSLLTTGLLNLAEKLELGRLLGGLAALDVEPLRPLTVEAWLARDVRHEQVRAVVRATLRLSTYQNAPALMSAGAALAQLKLVLGHSVYYLDGGWEVLVGGFRPGHRQALRRPVRARLTQAREGARDRPRQSRAPNANA